MKLPQSADHRVFAVDLERLEDVSSGVNRLVTDVGPITIWANITGGPKAGPLMEASPDEMERAFRGHVMASQIILRALLPGMKSAGYGRILNVLSTSVKIPIPNLGVSNLIRAAMASWAKTLSLELGPFGITVNNILPGYTETPRLEALVAGQAKKLGLSGEEVRQTWLDSIPLKRLGLPDDLAHVLSFLASPLGGYVSGVQLPVDGGRTGAF
jgi:3-oxoacyl-[acyl-carrier protein] reductase